MIQGFTTHFSGFDKYFKVFNNFFLSLELVQFFRP
jgi:hypothetical protein